MLKEVETLLSSLSKLNSYVFSIHGNLPLLFVCDTYTYVKVRTMLDKPGCVLHINVSRRPGIQKSDIICIILHSMPYKQDGCLKQSLMLWDIYVGQMVPLCCILLASYWLYIDVTKLALEGIKLCIDCWQTISGMTNMSLLKVCCRTTNYLQW